MRLCQKLAQPSFMILVSIWGMKYCACSCTMVSKIFFPLGQLRIVIADEQQQVFVGIERHFSQIGRRPALGGDGPS